MRRLWILICLLLFGHQVLKAQLNTLIPQPVEITQSKGEFTITDKVTIVYSSLNKELKEIAMLLSEQLAAPTGYKLRVQESAKSRRNSIRLEINRKPDPVLGEEGYQLTVNSRGVKLSANRPAGLFYGTQSLLQLLPAEREIKEAKSSSWSLPLVEILDYPRFGWRGLMLDVSRHFFPKEFIKKYIDQMVKYKYNVFHWHLTDDPGWRIEIKRYPRLTETGAWRVSRTGAWRSYGPPQPGEAVTYGGYYTQEDIKEIVAYAQERFVTIVPEVDVPGHSGALVVAYPSVSCTGEQYNLYPGSNEGLGANVLCAGNEESFIMLNNIFNEIASLFPGNYIHVGGDEVDKSFWKKCTKCQRRMRENGLKNEHELQSYFMKRVENMLSSKGKTMIGWDEILEGGLAPGAAVMSWRGLEGGIEAAKQGHNVVMSPLQYTYFDYQQSDIAIEQTGGGYVKLSDTYKFEPVPPGVDGKYILGGQGNIWTEYISTPGRAEYMTWPRALALSEILWSPKKERDFKEFIHRVEAHLIRFDKVGVNYSPSIYDPHILPVKSSDGKLQILFHKEVTDIEVYYTFDSTYPDNYSKKYNGKPIVIPKGASVIRAITYRNGVPIGRLLSISLKELAARL